MKINTILFLFTALGLLAQEPPTQDPDPGAYRINLLPQDLKANLQVNDRPVPNIQDLAVLGWSKDGKIAVLLGSPSPFRPDYRASFMVIDLVSDRRLALLGPQSMRDVVEDYGMMLEPLPGNPENPMSLEYFYELNQSRIYRLLLEHSILPQNGVFGQGPILQEERRIQFLLEVMSKTPRWDMGEPAVYEKYAYTVRAADSLTGAKVLGQRTYDTAYLLGAQILGYILSPFENRAAVIVAETSWGIELEHSSSFDLFGAHLDSGY
jgi:hypothetical protein